MIAKLVVAGVLAALPLLSGCDQALKADESGPSGPGTAPDAADLVCSSRRDCTYDIVPLVQTEADCSCPKCPVEATPISRTSYDQRAKQFAKVCAQWSKTNACPPTFCPPVAKLSCAEGECSLNGGKGGTP